MAITEGKLHLQISDDTGRLLVDIWFDPENPPDVAELLNEG